MNLIRVLITDEMNLEIYGLNMIPENHAKKCLEYIKLHKFEIINALNNGLPDNCPLLTYNNHEKCRYRQKLFKQLIMLGSLSIKGGCPLAHVCKS